MQGTRQYAPLVGLFVVSLGASLATMDLAVKDLGFAMGLGRDFGVPLDLGGLAYQTFVRARSQYGGGAMSTQAVKLLEDTLRTDLRAPGFPAELV